MKIFNTNIFVSAHNKRASKVLKKVINEKQTITGQFQISPSFRKSQIPPVVIKRV